jgi:hypothetical protein
LFTGTTDLMQKLQIAGRDLAARSGDRQARQISPVDPRRTSPKRAAGVHGDITPVPSRRNKVEIRRNRPIGHITTNALSINAAPRGAPVGRPPPSCPRQGCYGPSRCGGRARLCHQDRSRGDTLSNPD